MAVLATPATAQSSQFDSVLSDSNWYVPVPQLLAYGAPSTSFANPIPLGDQTLWSLGTSTNGAFTGLLSAELSLGNIDTPSSMKMQGQVAPDGSVVIIFTETDGSDPVVGLGQMKTVDGQPAMLMQMITGTDFLVTHWAYMLTYDPSTFTPPPPQAIPVTLSSRQWTWTEGTPWRMVDPALFGSSAPGTFVITDYVNGYFWGKGIGPDGDVTYTLLGSITPDGKVLYNAIADGELVSLYGDIRGDAHAAGMILSGYSTSGIDDSPSAWISLVSPYADTVAAAGLGAALPAADVLYDIAGSEAGLYGPMAPATLTLNGLSDAALAAAVASTLPVIAGAGVRATADSQRMLDQVLAARIASAGRAANDDWTAWLRPLGGGLSQADGDGLPGYSATTGGVAVGFERSVSSALSLGTAFAYSSTSVSGERADAPGSLSVDSYMLGLYGSYALTATAGLDLQLGLGLNDNAASRPLAFLGQIATADYQGISAAATLRLRDTYTLAPGFTATPALTAGFLQVTADAYQETGAGGLDLSVDYQAYQELPIGAELALDYRLPHNLTLSAHGGVSYNLLDTTAPVTASFAGGGTPFVTEAAPASPWLMTAGLGLAGNDGKGHSLGLYYDLQASPEGFLSQAGSVGIELAF